MTTPADELRAAAQRLRSEHASMEAVLDASVEHRETAVRAALADWLDETARNAEPFGPINARAVEVARAINASA